MIVSNVDLTENVTGTGSGEKHVFRIEGLSCSNCAARFERNVNRIPSVRRATVHFTTAKLVVEGNPTEEELEQAGAFDQLKIVKHVQRRKVSPWKSMASLRTVLSGVFLLIGACVVWFTEESEVSMFAFGLAILLGGYALFWQGIKNLRTLTFDMKTLMTVAVFGALWIGEWGEAATVVLLFALSEALEQFSMEKARRAVVDLMSLAPAEARVLRDGAEITLPVEEICVGDRLIVKPGEKISMDGKILEGTSSVNQAAITGESIPVLKKEGDEVYAGTINEQGWLKIQVTKTAEENTIAKMIALVEEAQEKKAPSQAFIDRFAQVYTPLVMLIAVLTAILPPLLFSADWSEWFYRSLALLVVACPCALVISTPVAIVTALGSAARNGVLIKGGIHLEQLSAVRVAAFDKTGTLTQGVPRVTDVVSLSASSADPNRLPTWFDITARIEAMSEHPLASAIVREWEEHRMEQEKHIDIEQFRSTTGLGVEAVIDGQPFLVGSAAFFDQTNSALLSKEVRALVNRYQEEGKTVVLAGTPQRIDGLVAIADQIREESVSVLQRLKRLGVQTLLLTGDHPRTAQAIAKQAGIDEVKAGLLPEEKQRMVEELKAEEKRVMMIGDGVNDTPALAAANVGVAMGGAGSDSALDTADLILMADELRNIPFAIRLSRKAVAVIKQNIIISFGLKLLALLLILPGWLTLWLAIIADMGATLLVTLNGMRLLRITDKGNGELKKEDSVLKQGGTISA